ncbi:MAG: hypothetical protein U1F42_08005 [Candidatus Competibacteraceae bacterium]
MRSAPLNGVLAWRNCCEELAEPPATAVCRHHPTLGSNLLAIINDILDFSKIGGRLELEHLAFDPRELIEGYRRAVGRAGAPQGSGTSGRSTNGPRRARCTAIRSDCDRSW